MKHKRDYFAHHFFRDEVGNLLTDERRLFLLLSMAALRQEVKAAEVFADQVSLEILGRWFPDGARDRHLDDFAKELRTELIKEPSRKVGWASDPEETGDALQPSSLRP